VGAGRPTGSTEEPLRRVSGPYRGLSRHIWRSLSTHRSAPTRFAYASTREHPRSSSRRQTLHDRAAPPVLPPHRIWYTGQPDSYVVNRYTGTKMRTGLSRPPGWHALRAVSPASGPLSSPEPARYAVACLRRLAGLRRVAQRFRHGPGGGAAQVGGEASPRVKGALTLIRCSSCEVHALGRLELRDGTCAPESFPRRYALR
jgi:hypothetical protein